MVANEKGRNRQRKRRFFSDTMEAQGRSGDENVMPELIWRPCKDPGDREVQCYVHPEVPAEYQVKL